MDIPRFLDLASELELKISELYGTIANLSCDTPVAKRLRKLADEEIKHANILNIGKAYYKEMPDLFSGIEMDESEALKGLRDLRAYHAWPLQREYPLASQIKKMLEFEKRFERIHMGVLAEIKEPTLKKLFFDLTQGDQSHMQVLAGLVESIGEGGMRRGPG